MADIELIRNYLLPWSIISLIIPIQTDNPLWPCYATDPGTHYVSTSNIYTVASIVVLYLGQGSLMAIIALQDSFNCCSISCKIRPACLTFIFYLEDSHFPKVISFKSGLNVTTGILIAIQFTLTSPITNTLVYFHILMIEKIRI